MTAGVQIYWWARGCVACGSIAIFPGDARVNIALVLFTIGSPSSRPGDP